MLRAGSPRRQADARRLRLLAFDVFFLGTATSAPGLVGAEGVERRPPRVAILGDATARPLVQVGPARGAEPPAVVTAQRRLRELEQHGLARQWLEVDLVVDERVALPLGRPLRSEERRVGKECGSRWGRERSEGEKSEQ